MGHNERMAREMLAGKVGGFETFSPEGINLQMLVSHNDAWTAIARPDPAFYTKRLREHALHMIPGSICKLRDEPVVYAVDHIVYFILTACERISMNLEHFISKRNLADLRRAALLRSGRYPLTTPLSGNLAEGLRSHALIAGITPIELEIDEAEAERCLAEYLFKGNGRLPKLWPSAKKAAEEMNTRLAA